MEQHTHIGVYALTQQGNRMLFIEKARGPYTGKWDLPGGGFEFGESPEETLKREVREETGFAVLQHRLVDVVSHTVTYTKANGEAETLHHIGVLYRIEVDANTEQLNAVGDGEDSLGARWISISAINDANFSPFAYQSKQYIAK